MFVLVVRNNSNPKAIEASLLLSAYLDSLGLESAFVDSSALYKGATLEQCGLGEKAIGLAVVLGGDGTILHTAKLLRKMSCQILGINFGNLGFLANDGESGVIELVTDALSGELRESIRSNLEIEVYCDLVDGQEALNAFNAESVGSERMETKAQCDKSALQHTDGKNMEVVKDENGPRLRRSAFALNELVVTRGSLGRTIEYCLDVSGVHLGDVSGDGVIVATSTGSTAYSLAAGGPIVHPSFDGMIIQPLAPHTLTARAILTNSQDVISLDLSKTREGREATLFIDGDILDLPAKPVEVIVRRGSRPTRLLYRDGEHFYKYCASTFFKS